MKPRKKPARKVTHYGALRVEKRAICRICDRNEARYTSGCCALCDMALPEAERGTLYRLAAPHQSPDATPANKQQSTGYSARDEE